MVMIDIGFESQRNSYGKLPITVPLRLKPLDALMRAGEKIRLGKKGGFTLRQFDPVLAGDINRPLAPVDDFGRDGIEPGC